MLIGRPWESDLKQKYKDIDRDKHRKAYNCLQTGGKDQERSRVRTKNMSLIRTWKRIKGMGKDTERTHKQRRGLWQGGVHGHGEGKEQVDDKGDGILPWHTQPLLVVDFGCRICGVVAQGPQVQYSTVQYSTVQSTQFPFVASKSKIRHYIIFVCRVFLHKFFLAMVSIASS